MVLRMFVCILSSSSVRNHRSGNRTVRLEDAQDSVT